MAILYKTQLGIDIAADANLTTNQKTILTNMVDSYEDVFPQLTTVQRDALTPTLGQVVFNTDNARYEYWNGAEWFGIGQDLATPLVVKKDITSAEILASSATPITLVSAYGAGYAILPTSLAYRFTFATTQYSGSYFLNLKSARKTTSDAFLSLASAMLNSGANRSGSLPANTGTGIDAIVEDDDIELKSTASISAGDGVLTVWLTYSIITY